MRCAFLVILILIGTTLSAQSKEWNTWYFGLKLGMTFDNGVRTILSNSTLGANYGAASMSYPSDGSYMMSTNGTQVFSKNFQQINGALNTQTPIFSFFVPDPEKELAYYLFVIDNAANIHYVHIDHSDPSGVGVIDQSDKLLRGNADHHLTAVKRLYGDGYWLITHSKGNNEFQVFAITKDGINPQPVISNVGSATRASKSWVYGNMVSDKLGERILHCFSRTGGKSVAEIFLMDKRCGTLSLSQTLDMNGASNCCQGAFSMNDRYVYVASPSVEQFDLNDPSPVLNGKYLNASGTGHPKMVLAPDGLIYMSRADNGNVTSKVCTIEDANTANPTFFYDKVNLNLNTDYRYVENFPAFIMDWSVPQLDPNYPLPVLTMSSACTGDPTSFSVSGNFLYDSLEWDFGDGGRSKLLNPQHTYTTRGRYEVKFNWFLCGQKYTMDSILGIGERFSPLFGPDTLLCAGTPVTLSVPASVSSFLWYDGDTRTSKIIEEKGMYWLELRDETCISRDSIFIDYRPDIFIDLGIGHFLCPLDSQLHRLDAGKGFDTYRWTPTGDTTRWIDVMKEGDYFVVVQDFYGCPGDGGTTIERRCPVFLELPNVFSPNQDGINDAFYVVAEDVVEMKLQIFNRWGAEIYSSTSIADTWDGTVKGKAVPEGVYVVIISYSGYENGRLKRFNHKQSLHIIR